MRETPKASTTKSVWKHTDGREWNSGMVIMLMDIWAIRSVTSYYRLADNGRHSETERVLVNDDRLAILSLLKIQSGHLGNPVDQPFDGDKHLVSNREH